MNASDALIVSAICESCVVVATYASRTPPASKTVAAISTHSHGASMSNTTRSYLECTASCTDPRVSDQFSGSSPKYISTFFLATDANSSRRSKESTLPVVPTALRREIESAPEPTPASRTLTPGAMSANPRMNAASFGYTMVAPRGIESTKSPRSGLNARNFMPAVVSTTEPSGVPTSSL